MSHTHTPQPQNINLRIHTSKPSQNDLPEGFDYIKKNLHLSHFLGKNAWIREKDIHVQSANSPNIPEEKKWTFSFIYGLKALKLLTYQESGSSIVLLCTPCYMNTRYPESFWIGGKLLKLRELQNCSIARFSETELLYRPVIKRE